MTHCDDRIQHIDRQWWSFPTRTCTNCQVTASVSVASQIPLTRARRCLQRNAELTLCNAVTWQEAGYIIANASHERNDENNHTVQVELYIYLQIVLTQTGIGVYAHVQSCANISRHAEETSQNYSGTMAEVPVWKTWVHTCMYGDVMIDRQNAHTYTCTHADMRASMKVKITNTFSNSGIFWFQEARIEAMVVFDHLSLVDFPCAMTMRPDETAASTTRVAGKDPCIWLAASFTNTPVEADAGRCW